MSAIPPPPPQVAIGYAAKRPSIHFEEEELRPKVVFPDQDEDLSQHFAKEDILPEEDQFSKLENSWGAVRQVGIKCKCCQLRILLQDYEYSTVFLREFYYLLPDSFSHKPDPLNRILLRIRFCKHSADPEI